jgi:hypothetical protein
VDLEVRTDDLAVIRQVERPAPDPTDGQVVLAIDTFGLSTNNVTFGVTGELLGYWALFPASAAGWGRVPVFGFAEVVASRHPGVAEGTRAFGYLPMSDHLVVEPAGVSERGFFDGSPHRRDVMAKVWNHYQPVPPASPRADALRSLLRPLFITAFLVDDFVDDHDGFGADVVVITSASAKTAIATGHAMRERGSRRVVGLTSPTHVAIAEATGAYDEVLPYDGAHEVAGERAVLIDIAGRLDVRDAVHERFGEALAHSMTVGLSNVPDAARLLAPPPPTGPAPEVFYAQLQVTKRAEEWGQAAFDARLEAAWERFVASTDAWLRIERVEGADAVEAAWARLVRGEVDPTVGLQLSLAGPAVAATRARGTTGV